MELCLSLPGIYKPVSRLVFGCGSEAMRMGEDSHALLDEIYACGINTFDTAENYGLSEVVLGNWIADRGLRDKVTIVTKGCHPYERDRVTPEDLRADIEKSFRQLRTDVIDVYLLHRDDLRVPVGPLVETLGGYAQAGRIRAYGGSNWTHGRIAEASAYARDHGLPPFTVSSPNFSLADQLGDPWGGSAGCVTIGGPENREAREFYRRQNIPILAYSSLGRGLLSGRVISSDREGAKAFLDDGAIRGYYYEENFRRLERAELLAEEKGVTVPQLALAWLMHQDFPVLPIVSTSSGRRMRDNLRALEITLTPDERRWLDLEQEGR